MNKHVIGVIIAVVAGAAVVHAAYSQVTLAEGESLGLLSKAEIGVGGAGLIAALILTMGEK